MGLYNLIMPRESAWEILNELGDKSCLHIIDPDPTLPLHNRPFANYVKRCDETYNKLLLIEGMITKLGKPTIKCTDINDLLSNFKNF